MNHISPNQLARLLDDAPAGRRYWVMIALLCLTGAIDYFDFYIVGFLVAVLGPQWKLTFGQSSLMLMSAGLGSIAGALLWGLLSDRYGRKVALVLGALVCGLCAGGVSLVHEGDWLTFTLLRFGVGFGLAGAATPSIALMVEHSPLRYRTVISGLVVVFATIGVLVASASAAGLLNALGWRGVAAIGFTPVLLGIVSAFAVPESIRWLLASGRHERARALASQILHRPVPAIAGRSSVGDGGRFRDLLADPRRFWITVITMLAASIANYGVYLWGPTIVAVLLQVPVKDAAKAFVVVALAGVSGKVLFSFLPQWLGRRRTGQIGGFGIAVTLAAAGLLSDQVYAGVPVFIIMLVIGAIFFDGIYSNITPYTAELFPVNLAARAIGLAQAANGVGKILGPLILAVIAGTDNYVTPQATASAIRPAFFFLAACGLAIGLVFTLIAIETHGRTLDLVMDDPADGAPAIEPAKQTV